MKKGDRVFVIMRSASTDPVKAGSVTDVEPGGWGVCTMGAKVWVRVDGFQHDNPKGMPVSEQNVRTKRMDALYVLAAMVDGDALETQEKMQALKREQKRVQGLITKELEEAGLL